MKKVAGLQNAKVVQAGRGSQVGNPNMQIVGNIGMG